VKSSRIFWGVLFVATGLVLLLVKLDLFALDLDQIWKFWPVILVLWGIGVLARVRSLKIGAAVVAALLLAVFVYQGARWLWFDRASRDSTTQTIVEAYDAASDRASFRFVSGAGTFMLEDTCADLLHAEVETNVGRYELESEAGEASRELSMRLMGGGGRFTNVRNRVDIRLHPAPAWDLDFEIGAARLNLDLRPFTVRKLRIEGGVGAIRVMLGDRAAESTVAIKAGVSSVHVRVPEIAGCEVRIDAPLSSKRVRGFVREGDGVYRTTDFASAACKIAITIDAGVSKITVERY